MWPLKFTIPAMAGGLSRWHSGKEPACQCKRQKRFRLDPWVRKEIATCSSILAWENHMDIRTWQGALHGVSKSWTQLNRPSTTPWQEGIAFSYEATEIFREYSNEQSQGNPNIKAASKYWIWINFFAFEDTYNNQKMLSMEEFILSSCGVEDSWESLALQDQTSQS